MVNQYPFTEKELSKNFFLRKFSRSMDEEELLWHWDEEDRIIYPTHETDWKFQRDNFLPQQIDNEISIKAGEWHRLVKGTGDLTLRIKKIKV